MNHPVFLLAKLFTEGGIEICTPDNVPSASGSNKNAPALLRTFIQPDGDTICFASPEAADLPEMVKNHDLAVRRVLQSLRRFRMLLDTTVCFTLVPVAFGWLRSGPEKPGAHWLWILIGGALLALKAVFQLFLNRHIRNKIQKLGTEKGG